MSEIYTLKYKHLAITGGSAISLFFTALVATTLFYEYSTSGETLTVIFGGILLGLVYVEIYYVAEGLRIRSIEVCQAGVRYFRHGRVVATIPLKDLERITFRFSFSEGEISRSLDFEGRGIRPIKACINSIFRKECPAFDKFQAALEGWCAEHSIGFARFIKNDQGELKGEQATDLYEKYTGLTPTGQISNRRANLTKKEKRMEGKPPSGRKYSNSRRKILGYCLLLAFLLAHAVLLAQAFSLHFETNQSVNGNLSLRGSVPSGQVLLIKLIPSASSPSEIDFKISFPNLNRNYSTALKIHIPLTDQETFAYYPSERFTLISDSEWDSAYFPDISGDKYADFTFAVDVLPLAGLNEYVLNLTPSSGNLFSLKIAFAPFYDSHFYIIGLLTICIAPVFSGYFVLFPYIKEYGVYKHSKKERITMNFIGWGCIASEIVFCIHLFYFFGLF